MSKTLIAYFTWSGNSAYLAEVIQRQTSGTLFQIRPSQPYPQSYSMTVSRAYKELQQNLWPELAEQLHDPQDYDLLYLIYPNWCGTIPMAVSTFLTNAAFSEITILPLCTSGGSSMERSVQDIRKMCPMAKVNSGLLISDREVCSEKTDWAIRKWTTDNTGGFSL